MKVKKIKLLLRQRFNNKA